MFVQKLSDKVGFIEILMFAFCFIYKSLKNGKIKQQVQYSKYIATFL